MTITLNGEKTSLEEESINITDLLTLTKAETPDYVTVQVNNEFIEHAAFATTFVKTGDNVEYLYFMGGGSQ